ncbi:MAG TPA: 50S ribosomal protein L24 [Polyangiaceae bacterium]|nr:50S ribosomal protein L24 [Polyangiaceae bacterium]HMR73745.1 50S ribosomal protein L24 [Polyangiaceae bacterium]
MERVRVGDEVVVISGNEKGKRGKVLRLLKDKDRVVIEGVNRIKRHMRATQAGPGGILEVEAPLHLSNVMPVDPEGGKPTRVRIQEKDGAKVRVAKSGATIVAAEDNA